MNKLSLDALRQRADSVASEDVLATISGGTENSCHDRLPPPTNLPPKIDVGPMPTPPGNQTGTVIIKTF